MKCQNCGRSLPDDKATCLFCPQDTGTSLETVDHLNAGEASSLGEMPSTETSVSVEITAEQSQRKEGTKATAVAQAREKMWMPRRERVEAWSIGKELNHYEVLDLSEDASDEILNQHILSLEKSLNKWAGDPMHYELQKVGSKGLDRIFELKQAFSDRIAYNGLIQREKHLAALKRMHVTVAEYVKDNVLQWNEWKFIILPKAKEEGIDRDELEEIIREMRARGVLTGLEIAGTEVRNILELKDLCDGRGDYLIDVIWNSKLEDWLERAALRKDLAEEVRLVKEQYTDNRAAGAQRVLWKMNEKALVLAGSKGELKITSVKDWVEGVYTQGLETSSLMALEDHRLEDWLKIAMNRERLSRFADLQSRNGRKGLWEVIWQTNEKSEAKEIAYQKTKSLVKEYPDFLEAQYQHAAYCALTNRVEEARIHLQKLIKKDNAYALRARSDSVFQGTSEQIQKLLKQLGSSGKPLKFPRGEAYTVDDLIVRCEEDGAAAQEYLFNGYIENWLGKEQGEAPLATHAKNITKTYSSLKRRGLELFIRELCKSAGVDPYPKLSAQPASLNFGTLPKGAQTSARINLKNLSRGYAWGGIVVEPAMPGLTTSTAFDGAESIIEVSLNTVAVEPGPYSGKIIIRSEGVPTPLEIPLRYAVEPLHVEVNPSELNFGKILHSTRRVMPVTISCQQGGRLVGHIKGLEPNIQGLSVSGGVDGAVNQLMIAIETIRLSPGKSFNPTLVLSTNVGELKIPIKFKTSLRWEHLVIGKTVGYGLLIGVVMYLLRYFLQSFEGLETWFLYYNNTISTIIGAGAIGALALGLFTVTFRHSKLIKALFPQRLRKLFTAKKLREAVQVDDSIISIRDGANRGQEKV